MMMKKRKTLLSARRRRMAAAFAAVMSLWCAVSPAQAQSLDDRISEAHHADVSTLPGKLLDYDHYNSYISTGQPWDNNKMFLLYNVGAKKFLNLGSYWGTHAAMSEVPRPFWLQRRNERKVQGQWSYKRFPESENENAGIFSNDFFNLKTVEVGNTEGAKRAHATYVYVRKVTVNKTDGTTTTTDIIEPGTVCNGGKITESTDIDFADSRIEAQINMGLCQATESGGGNMETLFSVGTDIGNWGVTENADGTKTSKLHIYGYRTGGKSYVRVQVMDTQYKDATHKSGGSENPIEIGDDNLVTVVISQQSVLVNGVQCMPRTQQSYESALTPFLKQTTVRVGSTQGDTFTRALYNWVTLTKTSIYDDDPTHVLRPDVAINGREFYKEFSGTLADKQVEATIDLSTCHEGQTGTDGQNVLSIGGDIKEWYTATAQNLHFYYNGTTLTVEGVSSKHTGNGDMPTLKWSKAVEGTVTIKANRTGLYVDGVLADGFGPDNDIMAYLINDAAAIQVGSRQGDTRSWATYKSVEVKTETANVVEPGYKGDGATAWGQQYVGTLADKQVEAYIDLSTCKADNENVLSVGTDISKWDVKNEHDIHMYYPAKNKDTEKWNYVQVDPAAEGDKYREYVKISDKKMHVVLNKTGLWIDGNLIVTPDNEIVAYLINNAEHIQVGSREGSGRSRATYTSLTVSPYSDTEAAAAPSPLVQAAAQKAVASANADGKGVQRAAEASKEQGSTTYIYKDRQGDGTKFWSDPLEVSFADGDRIEASICLDNSATKEDVISIGTDIDQWGNSGNMHNVHFYYMADGTVEVKQADGTSVDKPCKVVQAVYVNKDHSDDTKRAVYVTQDADGHYTMTLSLSKDGLIVNGTDIYPAVDPMPDLPYPLYKDRAGDIVRIKQDQWGNRLIDKDGHYIIADADDMTAHGVYVTNNGYIYTTESRSDKTLPLFITSRFEQETTASGNEDNYLSWAPFLPNNDKWGTVGVFADRALPSHELSTEQNIECAQWIFEPVAAADPSEAGHNTYRMYLKMKNVKRHIRTADGKKDYETVPGTNKFYLQASTDYVYGNGLEGYDGDPAIADLTLADASETLPATPDYAVWKLIDIEEYHSLFSVEKSEMTSLLDLTYTMRDPDFTRESYELSRWGMDGLDGHIRVGYDHFSKKSLSADETDYTDEQGRNADTDSEGKYKNTPSAQYLAVRQRTNNHARYMGVDVRGACSGTFYQDVTVHNAGWYAVSCGGMTTAGAQLFVQLKNSDGSYAMPVYQPLHTLTVDELAFLNATTHKWPFDQVDRSHPMPMYNALVAMNDRNIKGKTITGEGTLKDDDKAGVLADRYSTQVAFFVDPDVLPSGGLTLRVGIEVPPAAQTLAEGNATTDDTTDATADGSVSGRWTVFDNFHLMFGGQAREPNIIISEDSTSLGYFDRTLHVFEARPLRLYRTFRPGKWNTIILPVNLTKGNFQTLFGTTAKLAQLDALTKNTIEFVSAQEETVTTDTKVFLKAFKPYIIWVDNDHATGHGKDNDDEPYTALLASKANSSRFEEVGVPGQHFYLETANLAGKHTNTETQQYYYSFADDTRTAQTIELEQGTAKASTAYTTGEMYTYRDDKLATRTDAADGDGALGLTTLRAYGTLCKNFYENDKKQNALMPDPKEGGHYPTLQGGYVMRDSNLHLIKNSYGTLGLRCWFAPDNADGQLSAETKVMIDGIVDGTTGIADIYGDTGTKVLPRFADGVYTIDGRKLRQGTSLQGLPAGLYIVNGRKVAAGM